MIGAPLSPSLLGVGLGGFMLLIYRWIEPLRHFRSAASIGGEGGE